MKKTYFITYFCCLGIFYTTNAQNLNDSISKKKPLYELKLNVASAFFKTALDLQYEKFLNEEISLGISAYQSFSNDPEIQVDNFRTNSLTVFLKNYFDNPNHQGKYLELFTMYNQQKITYYDAEINLSKILRRNNIALGLSVGYKWISTKGFVTEVAIGVGRNLSTFSEDPTLMGRGGVLIGKRF